MIGGAGMRGMHAHELPVSPELAAALLAAHAPRFAGTPRRIRSHGTVNAMFAVGDAIVRMPFVPDASAGLAREARWLPWLGARLDVRVPRVQHTGRATRAFPSDWLVVDWIDGDEATGGTDSLQLADDLAAFVVQLRSLPTAGVEPCHRTGILADHDATVRRSLEAAPELFGDVLPLWQRAMDAPAATEHVWVHSDLLPGNVLVDGERVAAVIDWATAGSGDPACDALPAWSILTGDARTRFRETTGFDDDAWLRGMGWALVEAVPALAYYRDSNPGMVRVSRRILRELGVD